MDPQPTPFAGKRRSVAAPAKMMVPKPKTITSVRSNPAKKSPTGSAGAAPQPRQRRAFGTIRSSNTLTEKPPHQKKSLKLSGSPLEKPLNVSPPPLQKPAKVSPPPPLQKPSKQSPPNNPVRAARPSRPAAKPLKKACPAPDLEVKAKKRSQRVSFQEEAAAAAAPGSERKAKASPVADAARHTPMVSVKAFDKKLVKVVAAETPFFSAQNCSSCTLDQLESASYWLAQIRLAESVGKHKVAATFFGLAFECEAQPFHRIQSELRNYVVRHESASTLTSLFDELLHSHGMPMNQPKSDPDSFEMVDTQFTADVVDKMHDATTQVAECSGCDCGGSLVDVGEANAVREGEKRMDQPSFDEKKLDGSFKFDDCEAIIVDQVVEAHADLEKNVNMEVPCNSEIIQPACSSFIDKLSLKGSPPARGSTIDESHFAKFSPSAGSSSAKRVSSGSPFDKKSQFGSRSSKRLTSSCPSHKKSSTKGLPLKWMSSGGCSDGAHNTTAGAGDSGNVIQGQFDCHALVDQVEFKEDGEFAAINEIR